MIWDGGRAKCQILRRTSVGNSEKRWKVVVMLQGEKVEIFPIGELITVGKGYVEKGGYSSLLVHMRRWKRMVGEQLDQATMDEYGNDATHTSTNKGYNMKQGNDAFRT